MWGLLISTVLTSAADSLNPIAITQQFVLQGLVKKPKHIWYFILSTGITNLIGGFLVYFGLFALMEKIFGVIIENYGYYLYVAELITGIALLIGGSYVIQSSKIKLLKRQIVSLKHEEGIENENNLKEEKVKIRSVSPAALIAMGVGSTVSELTTALPYFAFLAVMLSCQLTFPQTALILVMYNIIYMLPLMILYIIYIKAQDKFDFLYKVIKNKITRWSNVLAPAVIWIVGIVLVYHSMSLLINL